MQHDDMCTCIYIYIYELSFSRSLSLFICSFFFKPTEARLAISLPLTPIYIYIYPPFVVPIVPYDTRIIILWAWANPTLRHCRALVAILESQTGQMWRGRWEHPTMKCVFFHRYFVCICTWWWWDWKFFSPTCAHTSHKWNKQIKIIVSGPFELCKTKTTFLPNEKLLASHPFLILEHDWKCDEMRLVHRGSQRVIFNSKYRDFFEYKATTLVRWDGKKVKQVEWRANTTKERRN